MDSAFIFQGKSGLNAVRLWDKKHLLDSCIKEIGLERIEKVSI